VEGKKVYPRRMVEAFYSSRFNSALRGAFVWLLPEATLRESVLTSFSVLQRTLAWNVGITPPYIRQYSPIVPLARVEGNRSRIATQH
jgi:hypothetical protein